MIKWGAMVFLVFMLIAFPAHADTKQAILPITATLIQCGTQKEAYNKCKWEEPRCCTVLKSFDIVEKDMKPGNQLMRSHDPAHIYIVNTDDHFDPE